MPRPVLAALCVVALLPSAVMAAGNHLGWCIGKNNPHAASNCGGSVPTTGTTVPTVPTGNQLPSGGTPSGPTPTQSPAIITVVPNPPTTITGTAQPPAVIGQPGPVITGTGLPPIVVRPVDPTVITGVGPVPPVQTLPTPSFTGQGQMPFVIQPVPPQILTGTSPFTSPTGVPGPFFTGQGLPVIVVVPNPPVTITGFGPVPASIIVQGVPGPSFTGSSAVPSLTPNAQPQQVPTRIPTAVPRPRPTKVPSQVSVQTAATIVHQATPQAGAVGPTLVTRQTGRQPQHAAPQFTAKGGKGKWTCMASGHGKRHSMTDRQVRSTGALRHVGAVDVLGRDLPALHPERSGCIIAVRRRR